MKRSVLFTGASGFLGSRVLERLARGGARIVCLGRRQPAGHTGEIEFVAADLLDRESCRRAVRGCDTVLHLAAATGKHRAQEYFRVNRDGTEMLLEEARRAGVQRFVYVSTIAVKFQNAFHYHYAESKKQAEALVRASGLNWTIVRPTMIFGPGSPVEEGLRRLAALPVVPVFGDGRTPVQPVSVGDAADAIAGILDNVNPFGCTIELGGPEIVGIEELLLRMRAEAGIGNSRTVHLPVRPIAACLGALERVLLPLLPVTAGQLASFMNPGTAAKAA